MTLQQLADQAFALQQKGEAAAAERLYAQLLTAVPDNPGLAFNHGTVLLDLHRFEAALASFDRALSLKPDFPAALNERGLVLSQLERFGEAVASFDLALTCEPGHAGVLTNRGMALLQLERFADALESFDQALAVASELGGALNGRGVALRALRRLEDALDSFNKALAVHSADAGVYLNRGLVLSDLMRQEEALTSFDRALSLKPDYAEALNNRGLVLATLGRSDDARAAFADALRQNPGLTAAHLNYAGAAKFSADDSILKGMQALRAGGALSDMDQIRLDLALAKAHYDLNDFERSFHYLSRGNRLRRSLIAYDEGKELAFFDHIISTVTAEALRENERLGGGENSTTPIFILGMPRSGTTLVEQILSSHRDVHGAGELTAFPDAMKIARGPAGPPLSYPDDFPGLDAPTIQQIAANYLAAIEKDASGAWHVTDKLPANFLNIGLIHLAFPRAAVVHIVRDALDTCVSRFAKLFIDRHGYAYDLAELGRYHRRYQRLMDHWHRVLPQARILDVRYEDVVGDLEGQARRIVAHCGLAWDANCLDFHASDRPVNTPSALQVRQPLYQSAVARAAAYEPYLGPLKDALKDN